LEDQIEEISELKNANFVLFINQTFAEVNNFEASFASLIRGFQN